MWHARNLMRTLLGAGVGLVSACAHTPPQELLQARQEYSNASAGPAGRLAPAELYKAGQALSTAEQAFSEDPKGTKVVDLAYVAQRRIEYAEALAACGRNPI